MLRRALVVGPVAVVVAALVGAVSLSNALASRSPALAVRLWPWNGLAGATLSTKSLLRQQYGDAAALALEAVRSEPANAPAIRTRGLGLEGTGKQAGTLLNLAERFSRRDLLTNLWLIEDASRRNDIPAALRHYDIALRTSPASHQLLFPILVEALSEPEIAKALLPMLAARPPWLVPFLEHGASAGTADPALVELVQRLDGGEPGLPESFKRFLIRKLAERNRVDAALGLYRRWAGGSAVSGGSLDKVGEWQPFDWILVEGAGFGATPELGGGLSFYGGEGGGKVAERLLHLAPGSGQLVSRTTFNERPADATVQWLLACSGGQQLAAGPIGNAPLDVLRFEIPDRPDCRYQVLVLELPAGAASSDSGVSGRVTNIEIRR